MKFRPSSLIAGVAVLAMTAAACTESSTTKTDVTTQTNAPGVTNSTGASTGGADSPENKWALTYTGGTAGAASGADFKIGYSNQENDFPEATIGLNAAVAYANAELGGIGGHKIVVVPCPITTEEDGQKCATTFANDSSIKVVMTGTLLVGGAGLYDGLKGKKPVLIGNGLTTTDFTTDAGVSLLTGAVGVVTGMAEWVATQYSPKPKKVAVMYGDNASAQGAFGILLSPVLKKAGIQVTGVQVKDPGGTAAEVQSAITNAGADTADVFITLTTQPECLATYDSLKQLGIKPVVVTTGLCYGTPMTDHIQSADPGYKGVMPDGWYFGGYGYNYYAPDLASGMQTYVTKVQQYGVKQSGAKTLEYTGFGGPMFANLLTLIKVVNGVGYDKVTSDNLFAALKGFKGPMMIQAGPLNCGGAVVAGQKIFKAVCSTQMGIQQYKDLKWTSIVDGLNGKPVDAALSKV